MPVYRSAVADWYKNRFGVTLDAGKEVVALMGSKDGIAHIAEAFVNPGDYVLAPEPRLPGVPDRHALCRGTCTRYAAHPEKRVCPGTYRISRRTSPKRQKSCTSTTRTTRRRQLLPTGFYSEVVDFARDNDIVVVSDNAYSEIAFDGYRAPSFLETKGAMEVGIEMHSLSKTYNMTGWRIGMAVGNAEILAGLGRVKTNVDSGVFNAVQHAAITALRGLAGLRAETRARSTRSAGMSSSAGLRELGFDVPAPKATFYVWLPVKDCMAFSAKLPQRSRYRGNTRCRFRCERGGICAVCHHPPGSTDTGSHRTHEEA